MTRKTSEWAAATAVDSAEFLIRQSANKRLPIALLDDHVQDMIDSSLSGVGSSDFQKAVLTADVGTTSVTPSTIFSFDVEANKVYRLSGFLFWRTTATTKGMAVTIDGTAGVQSVGLRADTFDSSSASVSQFTKTKGTLLSFGTSAIGGDDNLMRLDGQIFAVSAGTVLVQIAAAVASDYCAAQIGSSCSLQLIGSTS